MRNKFAQFSNIFGTQSTEDNWLLKFDPSLKKDSLSCVQKLLYCFVFFPEVLEMKTQHIFTSLFIFFTRLLFAKDCLFYEVISCKVFLVGYLFFSSET